MANRSRSEELRRRLLEATVGLLAVEGPSAVQVRSIAKAAGASTMAVYSVFKGIPDLLHAVADQGFRDLADAFERAPKTNDPVADIFRLAMIHREFAQHNPHLYDLMLGLSTRGASHATELKAPAKSSPESAGYQLAYAQLVGAADRLIESGRTRPEQPAVIAAQLWSCVHGFVSLELAGHLVQFENCVLAILLPLGLNLHVGLGDSRERAIKSINSSRHDEVVGSQHTNREKNGTPALTPTYQ